jgi:hypothetical protein
VGENGAENTEQLALPPDAEGMVTGLPSLARKTPMSWRSCALTCMCSVRSSVTGSPDRHTVTPLLTVTLAISMSLAVQLSCDSPRSAAHIVTGNGCASTPEASNAKARKAPMASEAGRERCARSLSFVHTQLLPDRERVTAL